MSLSQRFYLLDLVFTFCSYVCCMAAMWALHYFFQLNVAKRMFVSVPRNLLFAS